MCFFLIISIHNCLQNVKQYLSFKQSLQSLKIKCNQMIKPINSFTSQSSLLCSYPLSYSNTNTFSNQSDTSYSSCAAPTRSSPLRQALPLINNIKQKKNEPSNGGEEVEEEGQKKRDIQQNIVLLLTNSINMLI